MFNFDNVQDRIKLHEMDKLEIYLKEHNYDFLREDLSKAENGREFHKIIVYDENKKPMFDAICHYGSSGWEEGLLEISGPLAMLRDTFYCVEGHLTAETVIKRFENFRKSIPFETIMSEWRRMCHSCSPSCSHCKLANSTACKDNAYRYDQRTIYQIKQAVMDWASENPIQRRPQNED